MMRKFTLRESQNMKSTLIIAIILAPLVAPHAGAEVLAIKLDPSSPGRAFEGIGAVSAGASTRLLPDYPEPQRGQILDFLFKPKFGAGFQHLKVEIGSGENSTCGSEPSHAVTRMELVAPKSRGYEFWLMAEARKRNPQIILDCLPWGYPNWVDGRFSQHSADWFASFLEVARKNHGLELDWVAAAQNEMGSDVNWVKSHLRPTLDSHGFSKLKLQAPDDDEAFWKVFDTFEKDPEFDRLISAVGYHYLDGREPWDIEQKAGRESTEKAKRAGKPLWASEEWSNSGAQWGDKSALYLARLMNKLYTRDRITKFEIWCPVDSIYNQIMWADTGAMQADTPWSGHYTVWPAIWALAHTTQFAEPGWVYMDDACGQIDSKTWCGSHVALRDPKTGDWSVVIVTGEKCNIQLELAPNLKNGAVHVWKSTAADQFVELPPLAPQNQNVQLELEPDAIYTLTSTTGQRKGSYGTPPPNKPFPFPFAEDFETYQAGVTPRYFSDQKGTFEVTQWPSGGMCLAQIVPQQGTLWMDNCLLKPHTLFGDVNWQDCVIEGDVLLAGGDVEIGGRYADRNKLGYRWILTRDGRWQLNWQYTSLAAGQIEGFKATDWHHLRLEMKGDQINGSEDGRKLASVSDQSGVRGMAFLASTYDHNLFDNIRVLPTKIEGLTAPDQK
jgi:galactosylceramidase